MQHGGEADDVPLLQTGRGETLSQRAGDEATGYVACAALREGDEDGSEHRGWSPSATGSRRRQALARFDAARLHCL